MAETWRDERAATLKSLLSSGDYSDFTITCGSNTFKVHKAVVCTQSGFFKKAESFGGKETAEGKVDLPEDDPAVVKLMVQYLYEGKYDALMPGGELSASPVAPISHPKVTAVRESGYNYLFPHTSEAGQMLLHSQLYAIADKYEIVGLGQLAANSFKLACDKYWWTDPFVAAAGHALTTTPDDDQGLRKTLYDVLACQEELLDKPGIEALLRTHTGFAFGVLKKSLEVRRQKA